MIIDKLKINLYGFILVLAIFIGILYIYLELKDEIKKNKNILLFILMYISFAIVFGKIYTSLAYGQSDFFRAGLSAYGGLLGVIIASIIFEYIINLDKKLIKATTISLPLVYAITKVACFISGCCYGIPYSGIFSVTYPHILDMQLFPIQIIETITFIIIFIICHKLKNNKNIILITLSLTSIFKFWLDFLRYDHLKILITRNQIFSIILLTICIIIFIKNTFINKEKN